MPIGMHDRALTRRCASATAPLGATTANAPLGAANAPLGIGYCGKLPVVPLGAAATATAGCSCGAAA
eukprot:364407-Chlamydomonas_euryale.AAC.7